MLNQFFIQSMFTQMKHNCDFVRFCVAAQLLSLKPSQAKEFFARFVHDADRDQLMMERLEILNSRR